MCIKNYLTTGPDLVVKMLPVVCVCAWESPPEETRGNFLLLGEYDRDKRRSCPLSLYLAKDRPDRTQCLSDDWASVQPPKLWLGWWCHIGKKRIPGTKWAGRASGLTWPNLQGQTSRRLQAICSCTSLSSEGFSVIERKNWIFPWD